MEKRELTWAQCYCLANEMAKRVPEKLKKSQMAYIYGIPRGGIPVALLLVQTLKYHDIQGVLVECPQAANIIVDDLIDSGKTIEGYSKRFPTKKFDVLVTDKKKDEWIIFPWEAGTEDAGPEQNIVRLLEFIGEDPKREGLVETPKRILRSYERLFGGYKKNPEDLMKTFTEGACDEMVILKDIKMFSTCEHHMLPFSGVAHVAYIPNGKVIGVSKIARLVDMYSRRMQIQERIGMQVVDCIMKYLEAKGAACIIEAQHFCMTSRGVENQTAKMVTSALRGAFKDNPSTRQELFSMIKVG